MIRPGKKIHGASGNRTRNCRALEADAFTTRPERRSALRGVENRESTYTAFSARVCAIYLVHRYITGERDRERTHEAFSARVCVRDLFSAHYTSQEKSTRYARPRIPGLALKVRFHVSTSRSTPECNTCDIFRSCLFYGYWTSRAILIISSILGRGNDCPKCNEKPAIYDIKSLDLLFLLISLCFELQVKPR